MYRIAPSMLSAGFAVRGGEARTIIDAVRVAPAGASFKQAAS